MSSDEELRMSFTEHLGELRIRIIRCAYALLIGMAIAYTVSNQIIELLARPLTPLGSAGVFSTGSDTNDKAVEPGAAPAENQQNGHSRALPHWTVLNPLEAMWVQFKIAGYCGTLLAMPYLLWQLCAFVFPGLHANERRTVKILITGCSILATAGVLVAYVGVLPFALPIVMQMVPAFVDVQLRLNETLSILIMGILGFAIAFQFPMVVLVLVYLELITPQQLKEFRKIAIVGMSVLSAVLAPPDPLSMMIMLIPLVLLYECSILVAHLVVRAKRKKTQA